MSELVEQCQQHMMCWQASGASCAPSSLRGSSGSASSGGQPDAQGNSGEGARQCGAPAAGKPSAGHLCGVLHKETSGCPSRSCSLYPVSHSYLHRSALPHAYEAESSR